MALYDKNGWYNNLFGNGVNIFGAGLDNNSKILQEGGLLSQADIDKAQRQSLVKGLLGTAVGYLAQPKNQGYGSAVPYLAKAFQTGMDQAGKPYENLAQDAMLRQKMDEYKRQKELREKTEAFNKSFGVNNDTMQVAKTTQDSPIADMTQGGNMVGPDGQLTYAPSHLGGTQKLQTAEVAPQELSNGGLKTTVKDIDYFNTQKWLTDAVQNGTITAQQYIDYTNALKPVADDYLAVGDRVFNKTKGKFVDGGADFLNLTPGEEKRDEEFAKILAEYGNTVYDTQKQINDLDEAVYLLENNEEGTITGPLVGVSEEAGVLKFTNELAQNAYDRVTGVVQRNLRVILGAQFTENEGRRLIERAYNPALSQHENAIRVKSLMTQIAHAHKLINEQRQYFEQNGTLKGYTGPTQAELEAHFNNMFRDGSSSATGKSQGGWSIVG